VYVASSRATSPRQVRCPRRCSLTCAALIAFSSNTVSLTTSSTAAPAVEIPSAPIEEERCDVIALLNQPLPPTEGGFDDDAVKHAFATERSRTVTRSNSTTMSTSETLLTQEQTPRIDEDPQISASTALVETTTEPTALTSTMPPSNAPQRRRTVSITTLRTSAPATFSANVSTVLAPPSTTALSVGTTPAPALPDFIVLAAAPSAISASSSAAAVSSSVLSSASGGASLRAMAVSSVVYCAFNATVQRDFPNSVVPILELGPQPTSYDRGGVVANAAAVVAIGPVLLVVWKVLTVIPPARQAADMLRPRVDSAIVKVAMLLTPGTVTSGIMVARVATDSAGLNAGVAAVAAAFGCVLLGVVVRQLVVARRTTRFVWARRVPAAFGVEWLLDPKGVWVMKGDAEGGAEANGDGQKGCDGQKGDAGVSAPAAEVGSPAASAPRTGAEISFLERWGPLYAACVGGASMYLVAIDIAITVLQSVVTAFGLTSPTDKCQLTSVGVAALQGAWVVVLLVLRPYTVRLKLMAVVATSSLSFGASVFASLARFATQEARWPAFADNLVFGSALAGMFDSVVVQVALILRRRHLARIAEREKGEAQEGASDHDQPMLEIVPTCASAAAAHCGEPTLIVSERPAVQSLPAPFARTSSAAAGDVRAKGSATGTSRTNPLLLASATSPSIGPAATLSPSFLLPPPKVE
jgi:hypothetical protein